MYSKHCRWAGLSEASSFELRALGLGTLGMHVGLDIRLLGTAEDEGNIDLLKSDNPTVKVGNSLWRWIGNESSLESFGNP